jgi:hypothetical protein
VSSHDLAGLWYWIPSKCNWGMAGGSQPEAAPKKGRRAGRCSGRRPVRLQCPCGAPLAYFAPLPTAYEELALLRRGGGGGGGGRPRLALVPHCWCCRCPVPRPPTILYNVFCVFLRRKSESTTNTPRTRCNAVMAPYRSVVFPVSSLAAFGKSPAARGSRNGPRTPPKRRSAAGTTLGRNWGALPWGGGCLAGCCWCGGVFLRCERRWGLCYGDPKGPLQATRQSM